MKTLYVFHHTDLDGMGVKFLGMQLAKNFKCKVKTFACNYSEIDDAILNNLQKANLDNTRGILIGDISVNAKTAEFLNNLYNEGMDVVLRDHHASADWLNKYDWAIVSELDDDGVPRCGTKLVYETYTSYLQCLDKNLQVLVETINDWDCWLWKEHQNDYAKFLNMLHRLWGDNKFIKYLEGLDMNNVKAPEDLFTTEAKVSVDVFNSMVERTASKCEKSLIVTNMKFPRRHGRGKSVTLKCGVIFANDNISFIADEILNKHPEIDYIMCFGLPKYVSFRTQKDLAIPLPKIAKMTTGNGGGHPHSAGAVISEHQAYRLIKGIMWAVKVKGEFNMHR